MLGRVLGKVLGRVLGKVLGRVLGTCFLCYEKEDKHFPEHPPKHLPKHPPKHPTSGRHFPKQSPGALFGVWGFGTSSELIFGKGMI